MNAPVANAAMDAYAPIAAILDRIENARNAAAPVAPVAPVVPVANPFEQVCQIRFFFDERTEIIYEILWDEENIATIITSENVFRRLYDTDYGNITLGEVLRTISPSDFVFYIHHVDDILEAENNQAMLDTDIAHLPVSTIKLYRNAEVEVRIQNNALNNALHNIIQNDDEWGP